MVPVPQGEIWGRVISKVNVASSKCADKHVSANYQVNPDRMCCNTYRCDGAEHRVRPSSSYHTAVWFHHCFLSQRTSHWLQQWWWLLCGRDGWSPLWGSTPVWQRDTRTEKHIWRLPEENTEQIRLRHQHYCYKTQDIPTYFAIGFHSVTEGDLFVAPSNQLQHRCHVVACSNSRLSCRQIFRFFLRFSFLCRVTTDETPTNSTKTY